MKLLLFRAGARLVDKQGREFNLTTAPLTGLRQFGLECALCTETRSIGYKTKTRDGGDEFVCNDCVDVVPGAYEPLVLVQKFTRLVWTGADWSGEPGAAKVFNTRAAAEAEHERFGGGKHIVLVSHRSLGDTLRQMREERALEDF